jgi:tetratricopeptide (TPR) repeat protein
MSSDTQADPTNKIDRLLDAIELVKADRRETAQPILRDLISEDSDFEDAWLWMSLVVENLDQSILCLDNVLRINPNNVNAATALYRLRKAELAAEEKRARLRTYRDWSIMAMWMLILAILFSMMLSFAFILDAAEALAI